MILSNVFLWFTGNWFNFPTSNLSLVVDQWSTNFTSDVLILSLNKLHFANGHFWGEGKVPQSPESFVDFQFSHSQWDKVLDFTKSIHSKSEKVCGTAFSVKKFAGKVRKSGRHFWAIWGNFGPFGVIFGPFWIILGHSRAMLDHFGPFGVIFGPLWAILVHFWPFLGHFVAFLDKFAESSNLFAGSWGHNPCF